MKIFQRIETYIGHEVYIFAMEHEWRLLRAEKTLEQLVERTPIRLFDWVMPPWRKGKPLTRYIEPDTRKIL